MKHFEKIIQSIESPLTHSANIHQLANQLIHQNLAKKRLIINAKFQSLVQMYFNFFRQQMKLEEDTLHYLTATIPNDSIVICYAYQHLLNGTTH